MVILAISVVAFNASEKTNSKSNNTVELINSMTFDLRIETNNLTFTANLFAKEGPSSHETWHVMDSGSGPDPQPPSPPGSCAHVAYWHGAAHVTCSLSSEYTISFQENFGGYYACTSWPNWRTENCETPDPE